MWKSSHPPSGSATRSHKQNAPKITLENGGGKDAGAPGPTLNAYRTQMNALDRNSPLNPPSFPNDRVASSIYSHPDSTQDSHRHGGHEYENRDSQYTDVSPPVSPLHAPYGDVGTSGSPDISPVDEMPKPIHFPNRQNHFASALPVSKTRGQETTGQGTEDVPPPPPSKNGGPVLGPSRMTRWDDFSGEPTTSSKGKPGQATPGSPAPEEHPKSKSGYKQFSFFTKTKDLNQARKKFMSKHGARSDEPPPPREPWKGASGRSAIINPVRTRKASVPQEPVSPPRKARTNLIPLPAHLDVTHSPTSASERPAVPPKDDSLDTSASPIQVEPRVQHDIPNKNTHLQPSQEPVYNRLKNLDLEQQPSSRFSTTTYATTEAGSPPGTAGSMGANNSKPPVPAIPQGISRLSAKTVKETTRKPTPSQHSGTPSKIQPGGQGEEQTMSRIDAMEAKIRDLSRRRANIDTIIHELTQVIQPSSITYDMATRSEVNKTVQSLNNELAEIKKEEHEIGMKLHRAYKKRDAADFYSEPSGLWVRRVTS